jgi:hypothetical protein
MNRVTPSALVCTRFPDFALLPMRHFDASWLRVWHRLHFVAMALGFASSLAAEEATRPPMVPAAPSSGRAALRQVVQETYRYDPSIREKALAEKPSGAGVLLKDPDVVQMEKVVVTDSKGTRGIGQAIERDRLVREATKPSVANGVSVLSRPTIDIGVKPHKDILPFGKPAPRWSIIDLRW